MKYKIAYRQCFQTLLCIVYIYILCIYIFHIYYIYIIKCAVYLPCIKMMQRRRLRDGAYITHEMRQKCLLLLPGNPKERSSGRPRIRWKVNIQVDSRKHDRSVWTEFIWLRIATVVGCWMHDDGRLVCD